MFVWAYTINCLGLYKQLSFYTPSQSAGSTMAGAFFVLASASSFVSTSAFSLIFTFPFLLPLLLLLHFCFSSASPSLLFLPLKGCCSREVWGGFCLTCFALLWLNSPLSYVFLTILYNSFRFLLVIQKDCVSLLPDTEVRSVCIFRLVYPSLSSRRALLAGIVCRRGGWVGDEARHNKGVY